MGGIKQRRNLYIPEATDNFRIEFFRADLVQDCAHQAVGRKDLVINVPVLRASGYVLEDFFYGHSLVVKVGNVFGGTKIRIFSNNCAEVDSTPRVLMGLDDVLHCFCEDLFNVALLQGVKRGVRAGEAPGEPCGNQVRGCVKVDVVT